MSWKDKFLRAMNAGEDYPLLCIATSFADGCPPESLEIIRKQCPIHEDHEWILSQSNGVALDFLLLFGDYDSSFPGIAKNTTLWSEQFYRPGMVALGRGPSGESFAYDESGKVYWFTSGADSVDDYHLVASSISLFIDDVIMGQRYDDVSRKFGGAGEWREFLLGEGFMV